MSKAVALDVKPQTKPNKQKPVSHDKAQIYILDLHRYKILTEEQLSQRKVMNLLKDDNKPDL